jgi:hypothetical protein
MQFTAIALKSHQNPMRDRGEGISAEITNLVPRHLTTAPPAPIWSEFCIPEHEL